MNAMLALLGKLIGGLAGILPYAMTFFAGRRHAETRQLKRDERRRHAQLQIHRTSDNAVLDSLRRSGF
ncbi:MAG: hypothetical protein V3T62_08550 [Alphaproteobacteria bacterium]